MITVKWIDVDGNEYSIELEDDYNANAFISMMESKGLKAWKV